MSVPVPGRARALGLLGVYAKKERAFSEEDIGFLSAVANVLGTTMERLRTESALRQAQKMEAVGRLAGGIAHDFNNFLAVILANAELLKMDRPTDAPPSTELEEIVEATQRAASLTRQLLTYGRQDVGDSEIVEVHEAVVAAEGTLRSVAGDRVQLVVADSSSKGYVRIDRTQLEQILLNLVANARDAMPAGGHVRIEIDDVDLDPHRRNGPHEPFADVQEVPPICSVDQGGSRNPRTIGAHLRR